MLARPKRCSRIQAGLASVLVHMCSVWFLFYAYHHTPFFDQDPTQTSSSTTDTGARTHNADHASLQKAATRIRFLPTKPQPVSPAPHPHPIETAPSEYTPHRIPPSEITPSEAAPPPETDSSRTPIRIQMPAIAVPTPSTATSTQAIPQQSSSLPIDIKRTENMAEQSSMKDDRVLPQGQRRSPELHRWYALKKRTYSATYTREQAEDAVPTKQSAQKLAQALGNAIGEAVTKRLATKQQRRPSNRQEELAAEYTDHIAQEYCRGVARNIAALLNSRTPSFERAELPAISGVDLLIAQDGTLKKFTVHNQAGDECTPEELTHPTYIAFLLRTIQELKRFRPIPSTLPLSEQKDYTVSIMISHHNDTHSSEVSSSQRIKPYYTLVHRPYDRY